MTKREPLNIRTAGFLILVLLFPASCNKAHEAVDESLVKPVEQAQVVKQQALLDTALANARMAREALMRYPVTSPDNKYPTSMDVYDYASLRAALNTGLPESMEDLMWDPAWVSTTLQTATRFSWKFMPSQPGTNL